MKQFPFTDYDFWAYLSTGFAFIFVADFVEKLHLLDRASWTLASTVVVISVAYTAGHLIAGLSGTLFEHHIVSKYLGTPSVVLFSRTTAPAWCQALLPFYYAKLPDATHSAIVIKAKVHGVEELGEALFWLAFDVGRKDPIVMARLANFINMYGFCRNAAMVGLLNAIMLFSSCVLLHDSPANYGWAGVAIVVSAGMFLRYLKFYRHYALEVFTHFAYTETST